MKVITCLLYFILFASVLFLLPHKISATFTKYSNNPILPLGPSGSWDSNSVLGPSIIWDDRVGEIWYSGDGVGGLKIGYAKIELNNSNEIVVTKYSGNPIINNDVISNFDLGVQQPFVIKEKSYPPLYKIWFNNITGSGNYNFRLFYSTSSNGTVWNQPVPVIIPFNNQLDSIGSPDLVYRHDLNLYQIWFSARYPNIDWVIGYAESLNGIDNWSNIIFPVIKGDISWEGGEGISSPNIFFKNNVYYLFYDTFDTIYYATSLDGYNWYKNTNLKILEADRTPNSTSFDNNRILYTQLIEHDGKYYLFYSGQNKLNHHEIGVAISDELPPVILPSGVPLPPTWTPTPSSTPTSTPTPTPVTPSKPLVILVPGMGASWDREGMTSCDINNPGNSWVPALYVNSYDRLIKTLTDNAHLIKNEDLYVYGYDWRQPLSKQALSLKGYIDWVLDQQIENRKVTLIGHSLGGLVIRSYLDQYGSQKVSGVLTGGTPHQGTVIAYPLWENGEMWSDDKCLKAAINLALDFCRIKPYKLNSKREVVQNIIPSVKDLLPVFDYLYSKSGLVSTGTLETHNNWIKNHPLTSDLYGIPFNTVSGSGYRTNDVIHINNPSPSDLKSGDWIDGKPTQKETTLAGDGTILNKSSQVTGAVKNEIIAGDHQDVVSSDDGIRNILTFLNLAEVQPASNAKIRLSCTKTFLISFNLAATMSLAEPSKSTKDSTDGLFSVTDAQNGIYRLKITPQESGAGHIYIQSSGYSDEDQNISYDGKFVKNQSKEFLIIKSSDKLPSIIQL